MTDKEQDVRLEADTPEATGVKKLVVVGMLLAAGVGLIALVLFSPSTGGGEASSSEAMPTRPRASRTQQGRTYLDRPPDTTGQAATAKSHQVPFAQQMSTAQPDYLNGYPGPAAYQSTYPQSEPQQTAEASPEEQAYQEALQADLVVIGGQRSPSGPSSADPSGPPFAENLGDAAARVASEPMTEQERIDAYMSAYVENFGPQGGTPPIAGHAPQAAPQAAQQGESANAFQQRVRAVGQQDTYITSQVEAPRSPYEVKAGTVIPAALLTGINSEVPGDVVAQVTRDVFDSRSMRHVLIPKGSKLLGTYDDQVALGQSRVLVAWTRLIFPDGRSLRLPGFDAQGLGGQTGISDEVDHHRFSTFGTAILLSAVGAGFQLSQPQRGGVFGRSAPTPQEIIAAELGREFSRVATEVLRQNMRREPTIKIRPGIRFYVYLNRDLALPRPYQEPPSVPRFRAPVFGQTPTQHAQAFKP